MLKLQETKTEKKVFYTRKKSLKIHKNQKVKTAVLLGIY